MFISKMSFGILIFVVLRALLRERERERECKLQRVFGTFVYDNIKSKLYIVIVTWGFPICCFCSKKNRRNNFPTKKFSVVKNFTANEQRRTRTCVRVCARIIFIKNFCVKIECKN